MADLVTSAMQPMMMYQNWLQTMMTGTKKEDEKIGDTARQIIACKAT